MDYPGRLIAGLIAVILIIVFPLQYIAQSHNENIDSSINNNTKQLSDSIREKGYLDKSMYEKFINNLDLTGELYDIDLEDIHPITGKDIQAHADNRTESLKVQNISLTQNVYKKVSLANIVNYNNLLNSAERTDSTMIFSLAATSHSHTDKCYAGHRHIESGCTSSSYYGGTMPSVYGESITGSYGWMDNRGISKRMYCSVCHNCIAQLYFSDYMNDDINYQFNGDDIRFTQMYLDTNGQIKDIEYKQYNMFYETYTNPGAGWTSLDLGGGIIRYRKLNADWYTLLNYFNNTVGEPTIYLSNWEKFRFDKNFSCPYCLQSGNITKSPYNVWNCGLTQDVTPICDKVVTSITAKSPSQTIMKGSSIDSTATATYLDGHSGTLTCTVSGYDSSKLGTQTAVLTYSGLVDTAKNTGTKMCTVNVTVKNPKTLTSIGVNPATQIINFNEIPSFTVTAYYSDGSSKTLVITEYNMAAYDHTVPGAKDIEISYTEDSITKKTTATVYINALGSIKVSPMELSVERYTSVIDLPITVTASYLYSGNRIVKSGYTISGYDPSKLGQQKITISYTENGITKKDEIAVMVTVLHRVCPRCGNTYDFTEEDADPGCPYCKKLITNISVTPDYMEVKQGNSLPITVNAIYADGSKRAVTGWTSNYNASRVGLQVVTVEYGGFASDITVWVKETTMKCPVCGNEYPASDGQCPVCAKKVIRISVNPVYIIVNQYQEINMTVTATYADGGSKLITDWSIDCTTDNPGIYKATVSYKEVSTIITLKVISATTVVCPICGLVYEPHTNPKGCPICTTTITGIEAYLTSGSNLVQYGSIPSIAVVLIFRDTHREIETGGYTIENYNTYKLGKQTITVKYSIFQTTLVINVVNTLQSVTCPNGHIYYLNEDGTDPGCPYCKITDKVDTIYYYDITYFSEIIDKVYRDGFYYFNKGNYLSIIVKKRDLSGLTKMQNMFFRTAFIGRKKRYVYGGEVNCM